MIYDISQTIEESMFVYKDKPEKKPVFEVTRDHGQGGVRESKITLDVHTGTHLDAPLHMVAEGASIETMPLENLIAPCRVVDLTHIEGAISWHDLEPLNIDASDIVLFKTRNSLDDAFSLDFVYLDTSGAKYLAECGVRGVGTDALGIERSQPDHSTHHQLFEAGIFILEGLRLKDVPEGRYRLVALPLKLKGLDASPVRAILMDE